MGRQRDLDAPFISDHQGLRNRLTGERLDDFLEPVSMKAYLTYQPVDYLDGSLHERKKTTFVKGITVDIRFDVAKHERDLLILSIAKDPHARDEFLHSTFLDIKTGRRRLDSLLYAIGEMYHEYKINNHNLSQELAKEVDLRDRLTERISELEMSLATEQGIARDRKETIELFEQDRYGYRVFRKELKAVLDKHKV